MRRFFSACALVAVTGTAAQAQWQAKQFSITTRIGGQSSERSASLDPAALIGVDTEYSFNKYFGIGTSVDVARGNTHREDFLIRLRYGLATTGGGDSLYYQYLGQAVDRVQLAAFGTARLPGKRLTPFVMGGVGTYFMALDPQLNGRNTKINELSYTGGGGISLKLTEKAGIQLDARFTQYQNYNRALLNPARDRNEQITPFPEDFPLAPAAKKTALNTMFTLGFRYVPGGSGQN